MIKNNTGHGFWRSSKTNVGYFGADEKLVNRFKKEALQGLKSKPLTSKVNYNFGVSKEDLVKYRKQGL